ncbi:serine protease, partial [Quaeritorhiza haematococci]
TGFIVDVENALILTNKHVVTDAPFIGKVCFKNSEEVAAWPVWRDPVHDFGFLRFDKASVKFMDLHAVPLAPEEARVGLSVKVPGSDAGEKLAVLSGIIARIDRPAANTSGGSSGSPVIDIEGRAVALNAGGSKHAASSFFLPLERVKRALELLRRGKSVPRGTLQVEFVQKQYDECRRLGLPIELETHFRTQSPDLNGLLAVKHIIPGGPADGLLSTGDILIKAEDHYINHFVDFASIVDDSAPPPHDGTVIKEDDVQGRKRGGSIRLTVFRDQRLVDIDVPVQSLHAITPDRFVEVGGAVVHSLSYQLARSYLHPCTATSASSASSPSASTSVVFLCDAGQIFGLGGIPTYSIITAVAHKPVSTIDDFVEVVSTLPAGARVPMRYYSLGKKNVEVVKIVVMENRWGRFRMAVRDDPSGLWTYTSLPTNDTPLVPSPRFVKFVHYPRTSPPRSTRTRTRSSQQQQQHENPPSQQHQYAHKRRSSGGGLTSYNPQLLHAQRTPHFPHHQPPIALPTTPNSTPVILPVSTPHQRTQPLHLPPTSNNTPTTPPRSLHYQSHPLPKRNLHAHLSRSLLRSLCVVESHTPFGIDGHNSKWSDGVGIVVHAPSGLVAVDRRVLPTALAKVFVTFANSVIVPAK